MTKKPLFLLLIFLCSCASWSGVKKIETKEQVSMAFHSADWLGEHMMLTYTLTNHTPNPISILGPRPIMAYDNFVPGYVPPEFFQLSVLPWEALCDYAPTNSNTRDVKRPEDFLLIPENGTLNFTINTNHFDCGICNDDISEVRVALSYRFKEELLDKSIFEQRVKNKGRLSQEESDALFELMQGVYRQDIYSDTVTISRY